MINISPPINSNIIMVSRCNWLGYEWNDIDFKSKILLIKSKWYEWILIKHIKIGVNDKIKIECIHLYMKSQTLIMNIFRWFK